MLDAPNRNTRHVRRTRRPRKRDSKKSGAITHDRNPLSGTYFQMSSRIRPKFPAVSPSFCHDVTDLLLECASARQNPRKGALFRRKHFRGRTVPVRTPRLRVFLNRLHSSPNASNAKTRAAPPRSCAFERRTGSPGFKRLGRRMLSTSPATHGSRTRGSGPSRGALLRRGTCRGGGRR